MFGTGIDGEHVVAFGLGLHEHERITTHVSRCVGVLGPVVAVDEQVVAGQAHGHDRRRIRAGEQDREVLRGQAELTDDRRNGVGLGGEGHGALHQAPVGVLVRLQRQRIAVEQRAGSLGRSRRSSGFSSHGLSQVRRARQPGRESGHRIDRPL
ncbi:hypothetical protein D3C72_1884790 [compost metagenome]